MKYVKPKSVTWWSGLLLIGASLLQAFQNGDFSNLSTDSHFLQGLGLIGLRGAIGGEGKQ